MEKLAERIKKTICTSNPDLSEQQADTIKFGLECILSEASKIIIYFIVFAIFSLTGYYLVALAYFCIIRIFAGGYHANTYLMCFIVSFSSLSIGIITGSQLGLSFEIRMILLTLSAILVWMFAPVDHPNKPIVNPNRRKYLKYLSAAVFVILASFTFILEERFAATAVTILFLEALLLLAGHFAQRRIVA